MPKNTLSQVELLAPAKDISCAIAAIEHGADAVYIGGPSFSARSAAANSLQDIEQLVQFAHVFHARVYVAMNTLLRNDELEKAVVCIQRLYEMGVDALIVQDPGLLLCELPPIALHASTQMDNCSVEKVHQLERLGFSQVVLARELSLVEIAEIAQRTSVTLEAFVHGALCVSYSGRCYISEVMAGRSGNRGECAQFCRHRFTLEDARGQVISEDRYLLSLKDMGRLSGLEALLDVGIRSLKIEGRLKDISYVKNITALYRQQLDQILQRRDDLVPASSGSVRFSFQPDAARTFSRGETDYFLQGRQRGMATLQTPKAIGEHIGRVSEVTKAGLKIRCGVPLHNGDGLCYFDMNGLLVGFRVNRADGGWIFPARKVSPPIGAEVYRNLDKDFLDTLEQSAGCRHISLFLTVKETENGLALLVRDEDGLESEHTVAVARQLAQNSEGTVPALIRQLKKSGGTVFDVQHVDVQVSGRYYYPASLLNELRRVGLEQHRQQRIAAHPFIRFQQSKRADVLLKKGQEELHIDVLHRESRENGADDRVEGRECKTEQYGTEPENMGKTYFIAPENIINAKAATFAAACHTPELQPLRERNLMLCRYCIRAELGMCLKQGGSLKGFVEPFLLRDNVGCYRLIFDCKACVMKVRLADK